jgi:hypothetical protein
VGQDLIAEVKNGLELFGFDVQLLETPTFEPFMEEQKNTVTGVAFTLKLSVPWDWSACDIPAIWAVGGASGSGGEGTGYGITLRTNGVDNVVQTLLDLVEGTNITITDLGNGQVQIDSTGGGGGGGEFVSTEYNANHTTATGNQYVIGDRVWYNGNVYRCIANNDALLPTNTTYWTLVAVGYRLRQSPVDWNATSGDYQILNKPTITTPVNADWNASSGLAEILNKPTIPAAQVNSDWNSVSGVSQILNKPTIPAAQVNSDWNAVSGLAQILNKPTIPTTLDSLTDVNTPAPTNGQVLTYDTSTGQWIASNTATPTPTGYYGAFQDDTTQTAVSANTAYPVKFNTTDLSNGVTVVNDGSANLTRVTIANTGIYNVQFSLQLEKTGGSGNFIIDIWLRKNGVDIPDTSGKVVLTGSANASPIVAAWNYLLDLAGGDYVQLMWSTTNNNAIIFAQGPVAPHPGVPSSILTVTQQAGIMAGTGITAINSLTGAVQTMGVGTGGTDFAIDSTGAAHTFNLPTASAANRGALSSADWSTFNGKQNSIGLTTVGTALATLPNPSAIRYVRINADNTATAISAATLKTELGGKQLAFKTLDQSSNVLAFADVTDLSFSVVAGRTYKFKIFCQFDVTNTSTGTRWAVNGPAFTRLFYSVLWTSGTGLQANVAYNTYDASSASANSNFTANNCAIIEGIVVPSANGTLSARFANELTITSVTCKAGSYIQFEEI